MTAANVHTLWAELLMDGLASSGVREVVTSPGSRSTPLVLAAAADARLRTTVVLDERSAGFVALGQARVTGRPSLLVCTSGSAGASYLPAVVEAAAADVPLLVLTADRPVELQERQAAQTMAQSGLFGAHVRAFLELGAPQTAPAALEGLRELSAVALARSLDPRPGPVHMNARFAKPLEPVPETEDDARLRLQLAALSRGGVPRFAPPHRLPDSEAVRALAAALSGTGRGVILAGPGPLAQVALRGPVLALSERLGYPLLAEATSQLRFAAARPTGAVDFLEVLAPPSKVLSGPEPEVIVQLGRPVTSPAWTRWLESRPGCRRVVLASHGWNDPFGGASDIVLGDLDRALPMLLDALGPGSPGDASWAGSWRRADAAARAAAQALALEEEHGGVLTETGVARELLPRSVGSLVMVANSLAVREADLVPGELAQGVGVLSQRGVNGIDGTISGAAGAASSAGVPLAVLLGDLAFQHDLGGLAVAARVGTPLPIVVLANGGGRIFEMLPLRSKVPEATFRDLFLTPQALDVAAAALAFGVSSTVVTTHAELAAALDGAYGRPGPSVVVARISGPGPRERRHELVARSRTILGAC